MKQIIPIALVPNRLQQKLVPAVSVLLLLIAAQAQAFCGFYVARADTKLFNESSQVVLVRDGNRTVLTMANDYKGDPQEFALVVPVPTFIERGQIHVASQALIDHLDAYTAPRLVEYYDDNPCMRDRMVFESAMPTMAQRKTGRAEDLGVTIEAKYTVGEYDILILSAEESSGLETWLRENGYRIPTGAGRVLGSYLKQGMRFFVAKVNLEEQEQLGFANLRPLQIAFESPKFMLPIRLGTVNADGDQELFVYTLTRTGRVETTNYRTVRLPSGMDLPVYIKDEFGTFYRDMFRRQVETADGPAVFLEYAWDMAWCDPCAANPLSANELKELGVFWVGTVGDPIRPMQRPISRRLPGPAQDVFVTRLHLRYNGETFPEDLHFQETGDRENFQGRYVLRHPWTGSDECEGADRYREQLAERRHREAETLAELTGWDLAEIHERMNLTTPPPPTKRWWERLWPGL